MQKFCTHKSGPINHFMLNICTELTSDWNKTTNHNACNCNTIATIFTLTVTISTDKNFRSSKEIAMNIFYLTHSHGNYFDIRHHKDKCWKLLFWPNEYDSTSFDHDFCNNHFASHHSSNNGIGFNHYHGNNVASWIHINHFLKLAAKATARKITVYQQDMLPRQDCFVDKSQKH